jgi:hypothetical protein
VPEVYRVDGADMEMERVDGADLLDQLASAPWRYRRVARTLADLHLRLRAIPVEGLQLGAVGTILMSRFTLRKRAAFFLATRARVISSCTASGC